MAKDINSNSTNITDINEVTPDFLVTSVRMSMIATQKSKVDILPKVGVLVESPNNKKLFEKLLHQDCKFYSANGCDNVIKAVEIFNLQKNDFAIIGIIDADFRRISGETPVIENLFITDCHDTEVMIISSGAWENIDIIGNKEKRETFENQQNKSLKDFLLDLIKPVSVLRLLNHKDNLGLKFKIRPKDKADNYIDYQNFIDVRTNYKFSIEDLLKTVENKSEKHNFFNNNIKIKQDFDALLKGDFDLKELSNGHDFMNVLAIVLKKLGGNSQIKAAEIETCFIFAYHLTDFQKTNLYKFLAEWK